MTLARASRVTPRDGLLADLGESGRAGGDSLMGRLLQGHHLEVIRRARGEHADGRERGVLTLKHVSGATSVQKTEPTSLGNP